MSESNQQISPPIASSVEKEKLADFLLAIQHVFADEAEGDAHSQWTLDRLSEMSIWVKALEEKAPLPSTTMGVVEVTDKEFYAEVQKLAETNPVVKAMAGLHRSEWPVHLEKELMERMGIRKTMVRDLGVTLPAETGSAEVSVDFAGSFEEIYESVLLDKEKIEAMISMAVEARTGPKIVRAMEAARDSLDDSLSFINKAGSALSNSTQSGNQGVSDAD